MTIDERLDWIEREAAKHGLDMDSERDATDFGIGMLIALAQVTATDEQWEMAAALFKKQQDDDSYVQPRPGKEGK